MGPEHELKSIPMMCSEGGYKAFSDDRTLKSHTSMCINCIGDTGAAC